MKTTRLSREVWLISAPTSSDEAEKSFTFQINRATFPNWEGKNNKRSFVIIGDELRFTDPPASAGGIATTIFARAK